jgi:TrmH family RNA methyltransferase
LLSVALAAGAAVESVYVAPEGRSNPAVADVVARAYEGGARIFDLAPGVLERVADTVTPQPVLAVIGFMPASIEEVAPASSMVLVCADVRDPGNAGTVIRTADASGVDAVVCCDGTVDPTNPKTVRASAGSVFHTAIVMGGDVLSVVGDLHHRGFTTVGTVVRGGTDYAAFDWRRRVAIVLGNEASGLSDEVVAALDAGVSIPMAGQAESLNVSVSAAVLCFEALRQRRTGSGGPGSTMPEVESPPTPLAPLTDPSTPSDPRRQTEVPRP